MNAILTRWPPWITAVILALALSVEFAFPDYSFALDHAPTAAVCVDTSNAVCREAIVPMASVLARNRTFKSSCENPSSNAESRLVVNRESASDSGMSNPLKRWLC